jgi:regulator of protease activity HflC (stomatin/prohibitin superfamily)
MRHWHLALWCGTIISAIAIVGCASSPALNKEAPTSAIRAAEEAGASTIPTASLYLQLAKEQLEKAQVLAAQGERAQAESMLLRAEADAELAVALSRGEADKKEATQAIERVQKLRKENQLPPEGK